MMNILLIAATEAEIAPSIKYISEEWERVSARKFIKGNRSITIEATGVGMLATAYHLTKLLSKNDYDLVLQAGIAGSFDRAIELGTVVFVQEEQLGDFGAEDKGKYLDIFDLNLIKEDDNPFFNGKLVNPNTTASFGINLPVCKGLTCNTVSGSTDTIARLTERYNADIETMEGAAVHYICIAEQVKFVQVRAISNYVEPRDRENWKLFEAILFLNQWLVSYLSNL